MKTFPFDSEKVAVCSEIFPEFIESDQWVIFHGTSGANAKGIERDGFTWGGGTVTKSAIISIIDVFEAMKWTPPCYSVLKSFSLDHDFGESEASAIYFAETSRRALLYATRLFAGGEKLYAVRNSINQLHCYLSDPEVRKEHWEIMEREYRFLLKNNALNPDASRPIEVDNVWLSSQITSLEKIQDIAFNAYEQHDHGVIFAVKLDTCDINTLTIDRAMGIASNSSIKPQNIVGKVIIPGSYIYTKPGITMEEITKLESVHRWLSGKVDQ